MIKTYFYISITNTTGIAIIRQRCKKLRITAIFIFQESMQNHLHARKEDRLLVLRKDVAPLNFSSVHDVIQDRSIEGRKTIN